MMHYPKSLLPPQPLLTSAREKEEKQAIVKQKMNRTRNSWRRRRRKGKNFGRRWRGSAHDLASTEVPIFLSLLNILSHRQADKYFTRLCILNPSPEAFKQRRGTNRAAIGLECVQAIAMRMDIAQHKRFSFFQLAGIRDLIVDVRMRHEFHGNVADQHRNGSPTHQDVDGALDAAVKEKLDSYQHDYNERHFFFLPAAMSTSGRISGD